MVEFNWDFEKFLDFWNKLIFLFLRILNHQRVMILEKDLHRQVATPDVEERAVDDEGFGVLWVIRRCVAPCFIICSATPKEAASPGYCNDITVSLDLVGDPFMPG